MGMLKDWKLERTTAEMDICEKSRGVVWREWNMEGQFGIQVR
jgi:hypothetical protein